MSLTPIVLIFAFLLLSFFSGNNLATCSGAMIGSRIVSRRVGMGIGIAGYLSGLVLEGNLLRRGVVSLIPYSSDSLLIIALGTAIVVFLISHKMRVPQSLSASFASILFGIGLATNQTLNWGFVALMFSSWIVVPPLAILVMIFLMHFSSKAIKKSRIWSTVRKLKIATLFLSFLMAFTLGANTIGLLYSALPQSVYTLPTVIIAIVFGSIFLSRGELRRVGNEIISLRYLNTINSQFISVVLVETATLFSIPLSLTQTFTASLYGAGFSYKNRLILRKPARTIAATWIVGILASLALSYSLTLFFLRIVP